MLVHMVQRVLAQFWIEHIANDAAVQRSDQMLRPEESRHHQTFNVDWLDEEAEQCALLEQPTNSMFSILWRKERMCNN